MLFLYSFLFLLFLPFINAVPPLRFAVLGGSYGTYFQPTFPDIQTAADNGVVFYKYMLAVYQATDYFFELITQAGGIPLHDANNTLVPVEYTLFNLDWATLDPSTPLFDLTAIPQMATDIANPTGPYGKFDFVIQILVPLELVPVFSEACEGKCITINSLPTDNTIYICDDSLPDCVAAGIRPGFRRFQNQFTQFRDFTQLADSTMELWKNLGIQNAAIVYGEEEVDEEIEAQIEITLNDLEINIVDIYQISGNTYFNTITDFGEYLQNLMNLNTDGLIIVGTSTSLSNNFTVSIQNLLLQMQALNYMPAAISLSLGSLDNIDPLLIDYAWTSLNWNQTLRGYDFRAINSSSNLEIFSAVPGEDSPAVFLDMFLAKYPEWNDLTSTFITSALSVACLIISQKLVEFSGSTNYEDLLAASTAISMPSMNGLIQFDAFGRMVTIDSDSIVAQISSDQYGYDTNLVYPIASGNPYVFPSPSWSQRVYNQNPYSSSTEKVFVAINSILIFVLLWLVLITYINRNTSILKAGSPLFLFYFILGEIMLLISNFFNNLDPYNFDCSAEIWLFSLGFDLMFGSLFFKTLRIAQIFSGKKFKVTRITNLQISLQLLALMAFEVILNGVWYSYSGMQATFIVVDPNRQNKNYHQCGVAKFDYQFLICSIVLKFFLMIFGSIVTFFVKDVEDKFNESRFLASSIYACSLIGAIFSGIIGSNELSNFAIYVLVNVGVWIMISTCTVLIYSAKIAPIMSVSRIYTDTGRSSETGKGSGDTEDLSLGTIIQIKNAGLGNSGSGSGSGEKVVGGVSASVTVVGILKK